MAEIISFYSQTPNQGKRTLSQSFAKVAANNNHKVLYMELDYCHPSFANSTQISHQERNVKEYLSNAKLRNKFDLEPFILTKQEAIRTGDRQLKKALNDLPETLDFLTFPAEFEESNLITIIDSKDESSEREALEFVHKMLFKLENSSYDYVVLNLPNALNSIFGLAVMINSHKIVNVLTPTSTRLFEYANLLKYLKNTSIDFKNWFTIMNQTSNEISDSEYLRLINDENTPILIPYDPERPTSEFELKIGTEDIDLKMEDVALSLEVSFVKTPKRKKGFLSRG